MDVLLVVAGIIVAVLISPSIGVALIILGIAWWCVAEYGTRRNVPPRGPLS